jgi:hypothetical protein
VNVVSIECVVIFRIYQPYNPQGIVFERSESKLHSFVEYICVELSVSSSEQLSLEQIMKVTFDNQTATHFFDLEDEEGELFHFQLNKWIKSSNQ